MSAGKTPTFSWTPACGLALLTVQTTSGATELWEIVTPGMNDIEPGVRYGEVPDGATEATISVPLASGASYRVTVSRFTNPADEVGQVIGSETFTP